MALDTKLLPAAVIVVSMVVIVKSKVTIESQPAALVKVAVAVYPNPTSESVQVSFQQIQKEVTVRLFSTTGQVMYEHYYPQKQQFNLPIQAPTGVYILEISSTKGNYTTKIIKR